jgi:hypothetical protein
MTQHTHEAELLGVTKHQIDFAEQAHRNRRLAERTMSFRTAHEQFVNHFQTDEPDCVELQQHATKPPEGTAQCEATPFPVKRCYAWAKVITEGESPVFYVLVSGEAPYEFTYVWGKFA